MRIGLIDADLMDNGTRHPNLALMKIAGFYRSEGHEIKLIFKNYTEVYEYERVYISKVFTFTKVPEWVLEMKNVIIGGTGFFDDGGESLPDEIEHYMPYYDLYKEYVDYKIELGYKRSNYSDYLDYSIGFTTRGCFRKCQFCVNKKYDHAFLHSPVKEFFDESRPYIYLWDDNILALPEWEKVIDDIEETGRPFQFRQGIDIRLMTDRKALRLTNSHYHGDFIFAFDHIEDKELIINKVQLWKRYSAKVCKMYVLSAYKSQDETDITDVFERIHTLMKYGSIPYIMRYELYKESPYKNLYIELARWCNQPNFFKKMSFREFCKANQNYKKDKSTNCSAYQAMIDFDDKFPEISNKFFDLRYEEENMYSTQYGYGRKYANKPLCKECKKKGICWDSFINGKISKNELLQAYFTKEIDLECLRYSNTECIYPSIYVAKELVSAINNTSIDTIIELIKTSPMKEKITKENIPQYSDLHEAIFDVIQILHDSGETLNFEKVGYYLTRNNPEIKQNIIANKKYGENHAKLAALLDLVLIDKTDTRAHVCLSEFGKYLCTIPKTEQQSVICKLFMRIPIIQNNIINEYSEERICEDLSILSEKTKIRRRSNVEYMIRYLLDCKIKI